MNETKQLQRFYLADEHRKVSEQMCKEHRVSPYRNGKKCPKCGDTGVAKITEENCTLPCKRCVSLKPLYDKWWKYIQDFPELLAHYSNPKNVKYYKEHNQ